MFCDVRSSRLLDRPALNNVRTSSPSILRSCRGMNAMRPNCRTFPPTASCGYPPSCGKVCAKEKALRVFRKRLYSRAIQFAIIQRNYYITRKRRVQGHVMVAFWSFVNGFPVSRRRYCCRNAEYTYRHIVDDLVPPASRRLYLFENARV